MTSYTTLRKEALHELRKKRNKSNKSKKYMRAFHKTRGLPASGDAANDSRDEIVGAVPPKPFSIAVYRASSPIPRGVEAPYGS